MVVAGLVVATIVALALMAKPPSSGTWVDNPYNNPYIDFLRHACAFGILTLLILPLARRPAFTLVGIMIFATALEAAQGVVPMRTVSFFDLGANALGIASAWGVFVLSKAARSGLRQRRKPVPIANHRREKS